MKRPVAHIVTRLLLLWQKLRKRKTAFDFSSVGSILCIETSRMGDVVSMIPFLESLRNANPMMRLSVAVDAKYIDIIRCIPAVSTVIPLERTRSASGMASARQKLKTVNSDLTISMSPAYRNALLSLSTDSKFKIGYFESKTSATPFLFWSNIDSVGFMLKAPFSYSMENLETRSMKIAQALNIDTVSKRTAFQIPEAFIAEADSLIRRFQFDGEELVVLHPFSEWQYRSWSFNNYLSLANSFSEKGMNVIIIGSKEDETNVSSMLRNLPGNIQCLFGTPLSLLIALLKRASLFIGNDSGPLHLATAVGVPSIGLFGPASPALTAPRAEGNIYFYEQVECSPCEQRECIRKHNPCMDLISIEKVVIAAFAVLGQTTKVAR